MKHYAILAKGFHLFAGHKFRILHIIHRKIFKYYQTKPKARFQNFDDKQNN